MKPNSAEQDYLKPLTLSLLVHAFVLIVVGWLMSLERGSDVVNEPLVLTLLSGQIEEMFVPSELMERSEQKPEDTSRISDVDTILRGERQRSDLDVADQDGVEKDVLILRDRPESPAIQGQIGSADSNLISQQDFNTPEQVSTTQGGLHEDVATDSKPASTIPYDVNLPEEVSSVNVHSGGEQLENSITQVVRVAKPAERRTASAAASSMSFQEQKTRLEGRATDVGPSSWDARATTFGEYQAEIYRRVGELWHRMIRERRSLISYGRAVISVEIAESGRIMELRMREWPQQGTMLGVVSEASVRRAAPFPRFSDDLRLQVGNSMRLELTFIVY